MLAMNDSKSSLGVMGQSETRSMYKDPSTSMYVAYALLYRATRSTYEDSVPTLLVLRLCGVRSTL